MAQTRQLYDSENRMRVSMEAAAGVLPAALGAGGGLKVQLYDASGNVISFAGITSVQRLVSAAASNNATLVKAGSGFVFKVHGRNNNAAVRYLKLYNKVSSPTVGTDTPYEVLRLPASTDFNFDFTGGLYFSAGVGFGLVTGGADNDNTAVTAADILDLSILYQ